MSDMTMAQRIAACDENTPRNQSYLSLMGSWLWSRFDPTATEALRDLLARHGIERTVVDNASAIDAAMKSVIDESFAEFHHWCVETAERLGEEQIQHPSSWLPGLGHRLAARLSEDVPGTLRQVSRTDDLLRKCTQTQLADVSDDLSEYINARTQVIAAAAQRN